MTREYATDPHADTFTKTERLVKPEHYIHPEAGETVSIPASGMHALIEGTSHIEISMYVRTSSGATFAISEGLKANEARALAAQLLKMADECDGGKGKQ